MDSNVVDRFAEGGTRLRESLRGLEPEDLHATPGPGKWSIHQLVIHLADSDAILIDRMKRILTEDNPMLFKADESAYVEKLAIRELSLEDALLSFEVGRRQFARVLRSLPSEAFDRVGTHSERGRMTVRDLVGIAADHLDHHLTFLNEKRVRLAKQNTAGSS
jgi:uncharacterized damage-inducible protein DinB